MRKPASILIGALITINLSAQPTRPLEGLKEWASSFTPPGLDSTLPYITRLPKGNLNYLHPFYQLFRQDSLFYKALPENGYWDALSQAAAACQDYESALYYQKLEYGPEPDEVAKRQITKVLNGFKNLQHADARRFLGFAARYNRVIMIDESPNKPLHRAFAITLLEELYHRGFRYLALEMLNNRSDRELDKLSLHTGLQTTEPVAGELVRIALQIGYSLVSYEDTADFSGPNVHSPRQRDSIQASNIYQVLQRDSSARILVVASFSAIAKKSVSPDFESMAMAFAKISGIQPMTIDQTEMSDGGSFAYGKYFYESYLQKFPITGPSVPLMDEKPFDVTGSGLFDITIVHPQTTYRDLRPSWLDFDGRRQPFYIKPLHKNAFLVQAFYQLETFGKKHGEVIPADQTYHAMPNGNFLLYLQRGKYILVFRDQEYKILNTRHIEVN